MYPTREGRVGPLPHNVRSVAGLERAKHLLDEEGVALRQRGEVSQETRTDGALQPEDRPEHRVDVVARQRREGEFVCQSLATKFGQEMAEARTNLVSPEADNQ